MARPYDDHQGGEGSRTNKRISLLVIPDGVKEPDPTINRGVDEEINFTYEKFQEMFEADSKDLYRRICQDIKAMLRVDAELAMRTEERDDYQNEWNKGQEELVSMQHQLDAIRAGDGSSQNRAPPKAECSERIPDPPQFAGKEGDDFEN
ncbi:hypothetical protein AJ79_10310 [Helicocarpus griseus UAMH5409]|uniref:Uncharacterized protein n=1 Tax=Helicocarpus griseus UAMH5409 TaxID=1447875 RepID=A0A2B7WEJ2_9EURO|nr:hypothetical protein AJ79_10310 [Helicocarpus griseus UAMH5409]